MDEDRTVAALYVQDGGCYFDLEGVDPWPERRDAKQYAGPYPAVAHPPCQRWGKLWAGQPLYIKRTGIRKVKGDDNGCFAQALYAVRKWGGVLEHPWGSHAWPWFGLKVPPRSGGWIEADEFGGWTCCVEQGRYGHYARKPTLLLAYGTALPELAWGHSEAKLDPAVIARMGLKRAKRLGEVGARGGGKDSPYRIGTPEPFRNLLIDMARSAYEGQRGQTMYLQDFTGEPGAMLDKAFGDAKLNPKKSPDLETAMRVVGDVVKKEFLANLAEQIEADLTDVAVMYSVHNGEYSDTAEGRERDEYESGVDDEAEKVFEKWEDHLSANWLGVNTIETQLWTITTDDRSAAQALAKSAAKEIFKQFTSDLTPAQVLSSAGIVKADVEKRLESNQQEEDTMGDATELDALVQKAKTYLGDDYDRLAVYEDIEMVLDDDEILSPAAADRVGWTADDANELRIHAFVMAEPVQEIEDMIASCKIKSAAQQKREKKAEDKAKTEALKADAVSSEVLVGLKECGAGDTAMAEALGVSRSTYTNYLKGKTPFVPDADQTAYVREQVVAKANRMLAALAELDGTETSEVA